MLHRPGDHFAGGLVLGLAHSAAVPRLHHALAAAELAPPAGPALTGLRCPPRYGPLAGPGVAQVLVVLGPDRPA
jgi:hypothetical protein